MPTRGRPTSKRTALRDAITTSDVPTAASWLAHASSSSDAFERGVATLEALADPLWNDSERDVCAKALVASIEDWVALEESGSDVWLSILGSDVVRYRLTALRAKLEKIARLVDVGPPSARARYARVRELRLDRLLPTGRDDVWRIDRVSAIVPTGREVSMAPSAAVALAALRRTAAKLCTTISDEAIGRFSDDVADFAGLDPRCAEDYLEEVRRIIAALSTLANEATLALA